MACPVAYNTPKESYSKKNGVCIAKQSDSRPMEVQSEIQNDSEKQQRASY